MKALFLDRDGVINKYPGNFEYVKSWKEFQFLPGVKEALKKMSAAGFALFIISNQAGVSKRIYSQKDLDLITANMLRELEKSGVTIDGVYYCTHLQEENCRCRKPKTGLVEMAIDDMKKNGRVLRPGESYFVGDSILDIQTGKASGLRTILVFSGREKPENKGRWETLPEHTAADLSSAVQYILEEGKK